MEVHISFIHIFGVLLLAWLGGALATRLRYPAVLGELLAGILFGPPLLAILRPEAPLRVLAEIGVFLMMLYIGMEIEPRHLRRASGPALRAAVGGFVIPFLLGYGVAAAITGQRMAALFLALGVSITSAAALSRLLIDLRLLNQRIAHIMMVGALLSDTLALVVFGFVLGLAQRDRVMWTDAVLFLGKAVLFFGVTILVGWKGFPIVGQRMMAAGFTERTANFTLILLVALVFAGMAELAGLHSILGAFMAGLFLHEEVIKRKLSEELRSLVYDLSIGFLAPIFFVMVGFRVSLDVFRSAPGLLIAIISVALLGKVLGVGGFYGVRQGRWREALVVSTGMNGRGGVDVIIAGVGLEAGLIPQDIFSVIVFNALFTTVLVPPALRMGVRWLQRRGQLVEVEVRQGIVIVGAGRTARTLARVLRSGWQVALIDTNRAHCEAAYREGLRAIHGNALQEGVLMEAGVGEAQAVVAMTSNPEVNVLAVQIAREEFLVPEAYVALPSEEQEAFQSLTERIGALPLFSGHVRLEDWDHWISRGQTEWTSVEITDPNVPAEAWLGRLASDHPVLPMVVVREGRPFVFHSDMSLAVGDRVLVLRYRAPYSNHEG